MEHLASGRLIIYEERKSKGLEVPSPVPAPAEFPRHLPMSNHRTGESRGTFQRQLLKRNEHATASRNPRTHRYSSGLNPAESGAAATQDYSTKADGTS